MAQLLFATKIPPGSLNRRIDARSRRNWICCNSPPARWQSRTHVRRRLCGARFWNPAWPAAALTICQIAFSVIPSPHTYPMGSLGERLDPRWHRTHESSHPRRALSLPVREWCEYVFRCRSSPPEPGGLPGAGNRPCSTQQALHGGARTRSIARESHGRACRGQSLSPTLAADLLPGQR